MTDRDTSRDYRLKDEWRNGRNERNATAIGAEHLNHKGILYVPIEQLDAAERELAELRARLKIVGPAAVQELAGLARDMYPPKCETCEWWRGVNLEQAQDAECFNRDGLVSPPRDGKGSCCFHSRLVPVP